MPKDESDRDIPDAPTGSPALAPLHDRHHAAALGVFINSPLPDR